MPKLISISDLSDSRLCHYTNVRHARGASSSRSQEHFIAEGRLVVQRLIESEYEVESVLIQADREEPLVAELAESVPVYAMSRERISQIVGFDFHRGVMACGRRKPTSTIDEFLPAGTHGAVAIGLLGISDQENMGSILRTAAALGIDQILLGPKSIDPFSRRVIRVSMATVFKHRFYQLTDNVNDLVAIGEAGIRTVASTLDADALSLNDLKRDNRPAVLLVGNEATGIDPGVQAVTDTQVRIPMQLGTDSLNVATAAAILMYEFVRH